MDFFEISLRACVDENELVDAISSFFGVANSSIVSAEKFWNNPTAFKVGLAVKYNKTGFRTLVVVYHFGLVTEVNQRSFSRNIRDRFNTDVVIGDLEKGSPIIGDGLTLFSRNGIEKSVRSAANVDYFEIEGPDMGSDPRLSD